MNGWEFNSQWPTRAEADHIAQRIRADNPNYKAYVFPVGRHFVVRQTKVAYS